MFTEFVQFGIFDRKSLVPEIRLRFESKYCDCWAVCLRRLLYLSGRLREVIYKWTPRSLAEESQFPFAEVSQHEPVLSMCPVTTGHSEA